MFSTRRPRNLIAGISSGTKSFLKGAISGVVGLVAAPVVGGARPDGWGRTEEHRPDEMDDGAFSVMEC